MEFTGSKEVNVFLGNNTHLYELLLDAAVPIYTHFPGALLSLEVINDPNACKGDELIVTVKRDWTVGEALKAMDEFDEAWWLDNIDHAGGKMIITVGRDE